MSVGDDTYSGTIEETVLREIQKLRRIRLEPVTVILSVAAYLAMDLEISKWDSFRYTKDPEEMKRAHIQKLFGLPIVVSRTAASPVEVVAEPYEEALR